MSSPCPAGQELLKSLRFPAYLVSIQDRTIEAANPAAEKWGVRKGRPYFCGQYDPETGMRRVCGQVAHADCPVALAARGESGLRRIVWYTDESGTEAPFEVHTTLCGGTNPDLVLEYRMDITKQISLEKQLADERVRSEEHALQKDQFLANISHEIRTPLNTILGFADRLYSGISPGRERDYLDFIIKSGKGLLTLMNDLIDLSRLESGQLGLEYEMVNLHHLLDQLKEFYLPQAAEKRITLTLDAGGLDADTFYIDPSRVRQILGNLLGNAIKFTPSDGEVFLLARSREESALPSRNGSRRLTFEVIDTGIGIAETSLDEIFDPFHQHDGSAERAYQGTGMGLAICRRLIQKMGGKLGVKSSPGEGATFSVTIPGITTEQGEQTGQAMEARQRLALVVDDYPGNRSILAEYLHRLSFKTLEAENGEEALNAARAYNPDLVLMDLSMPVMTGFEAVAALRSTSQGRRIPVVAVSSTYSDAILEKIRDYGFRDFLNKPVHPEALEEVVEKLFLIEEEGCRRSDDSQSCGGSDPLPPSAYRLADSFLERYREVARQNRIDEIDAFGLDLARFGNEYDLPRFTRLGEALHQAAETFNIEKILVLLEQVPEIATLSGEREEKRRQENG